MILTCPSCASRYFVDDSKLGPAGRSVRCAKCGERWMAIAEPPLDLVADDVTGAAAAEPAPPPMPAEEPLSALPGEALPKVIRAKADTKRRDREAATTGVIWAGMAGFLLVLAAAALLFRGSVVELWPKTAAAYAGIGLPVNRIGLVIENVKAEPTLEAGHAALLITGSLRNVAGHDIEAPPLQISLLNIAGKRVAGKLAEPADPTVPGGQSRHFAITILDPPSTAKDLSIVFAPGATGAQKADAHPAKSDQGEPALRGPTAAEAPHEPVEEAHAEPVVAAH